MQGLDFEINLKSIQIIKPQFDSSFYQKLSISIILDEHDDQTRKMVRLISSKYQMNLYDDWDKFWSKQKQKIKTKESKLLNQSLGDGQLIIINESSFSKIIREIKINPSLRVILLVKDIKIHQIKQINGFVMVCDSPKEIQQYLNANRKKLILTSKQ